MSEDIEAVNRRRTNNTMAKKKDTTPKNQRLRNQTPLKQQGVSSSDQDIQEGKPLPAPLLVHLLVPAIK